MKKLLIMLFTLAIAFSLAMPVFAQDTSSSQSSDTTTTTKSRIPDCNSQAPALTGGGFAFGLALSSESPPSNEPIAIPDQEWRQRFTRLNRSTVHPPGAKLCCCVSWQIKGGWG